MRVVEAYQCEHCYEVMSDRTKMLNHENECLKIKEFNQRKKVAKEEAEEYLNSFRLKALNPEHYFIMLNTEMDKVVSAVQNILHFEENFDKDIRIKNIEILPHGFASQQKPHSHRLSHSAPVGKKALGLGIDNKEQELAFEVEMKFEVSDPNISFVNWLNLLPGINTGSGGSRGKRGNYHYYLTFWMDDFPQF